KVYSGGEGSTMKYDLIVAAGADVSQIRLSFEGVIPELTGGGDLRIKTEFSDVLEKAPYSYQWIEGRKVEVVSRYKLVGRTLTFDFPHGYDSNYELIIDPELVFATYSGATATFSGGTISIFCGVFGTTYDREGSLYVGVTVRNLDWPITIGAFQTTSPSFHGGPAIAKYNATGTALMYATYYGINTMGAPNTAFSALRVTDSLELVITGTTVVP